MGSNSEELVIRMTISRHGWDLRERREWGQACIGERGEREGKRCDREMRIGLAF